MPTVPNPADWSLIGRVDELAAATRALEGGEPAVLLHGEAGVGKSRLAKELVARARGRGDYALWIQATRSASEFPLGAYARIIPAVDDTSDVLPVLQRCAAAIREQSQGRSALIAIDDAHALDDVSAALTFDIATGGTAQIVATVRTGLAAPDAVTALWKDVGGVRIDVGALQEDDAGALAEEIAGGPIDEATRRWALTASNGNALYLRELVTGALQSGALALEDGLWRMHSRPAMTASLSELVTARLIGLQDDERSAVELLAVGEPLRLAELAGATDETALESLERRGIIAIGDEDAVRLSHPLYADVVGGALGALASRRIRRDLVEMLSARPSLTPADALRVAGWADASGTTIADDVLLRAAVTANMSGDPVLGERLASEAVRRDLGLDAHLARARARTLLGDHAGAEAALAAVDESSLSDPEQITRYAQHRTYVLAWGLGRPADAQAVVERLLARDHDDALDALRLLPAGLEEIGQRAGDTQAALHTEALPSPLREQFRPAAAIQLLYAGRGREAWAAVREITVAVPLQSQADEIALGAWAIIGGQASDDRTIAEAFMRDVFDRGIRASDSGAAGVAATSLAMHALAAGRLDDASRWAAEAVGHLERREVFNAQAPAMAVQAIVAATAGEFEMAKTVLARCRQRLEETAGLTVAPAYLVIAEARVAFAGGDAVRARALLNAAADRFASTSPIHALSMAYQSYLFGETAARVLERFPTGCESPVADVQRQHVECAAGGDAQGLLAAADAFEAIGALHYAVAATADAARLFLAGGREDSARRAAAHARELFGRGQGGTPPVIDGLESTRVGLSSREQSVVDLVRQGLTNAQIAERLVLSVRTVESHVYRASQKLGATGRRDL